jgi:triphosphoribosyl-dephospho-CoA synthase
MSASVLLSRPLTSAQTLAAIAGLAANCLRLEVETWPKPGLVSNVDSGSHSDMDIDTFRRSVVAIRPHLYALAEAGAQGRGMAELRTIGLRAESAMLAATGGVNTHRGAIFGLGLLCAAAGARSAGLADAEAPLGKIVVQRWGREILIGAEPSRSNGQEAGRRYGVGGARNEAATGFPVVYAIGVPALREGSLLAPGDAEAARVQSCFSLIATLADTNLLHRGGLSGLLFAQRAAGRFLDEGGVGRADWRERAQAVHREFVERRLSPGGSADLLAMSLFVRAFEMGSS